MPALSQRPSARRAEIDQGGASSQRSRRARAAGRPPVRGQLREAEPVAPAARLVAARRAGPGSRAVAVEERSELPRAVRRRVSLAPRNRAGVGAIQKRSWRTARGAQDLRVQRRRRRLDQPHGRRAARQDLLALGDARSQPGARRRRSTRPLACASTSASSSRPHQLAGEPRRPEAAHHGACHLAPRSCSRRPNGLDQLGSRGRARSSCAAG